MKGHPVKGGDPLIMAHGRRRNSLDEGPPGEGRRPDKAEEANLQIVSASIKGRPLKGGNLADLSTDVNAALASMKDRRLKGRRRRARGRFLRASPRGSGRSC